MVWTPGQAWPSTTPGGAAPAAWSGYVRFWLLAEIAAGLPFTVGQHSNDRLNAGNVLGDASTVALDSRALPVTDGLWVDLSCDAVDVQIRGGAGTAAGVLSNAEASTLEVELYDPTGKYDPLNPSTPFALGGQTRLVPGVRVVAFAEVVTDPAATPPTIRQYPLFVGTADRWSEAWDREPADRRGKMQATDFTKNLVKMDRDEQPPVGAGDTVLTRMNRIATYFGFNPPTQFGNPTVPRTLQATTLAQSAWEMLNRTVDDELGFLWIRPAFPVAGVVGNGIVYYTRDIWTSSPDPNLSLGCGGAGFYDIVTDAEPMAFDKTLINTVHAARAGGTTQNAANASSVRKWGEQSLQRTDLGLADDAQVAQWATDLVVVSAYPRNAIDRVVLRPDVAGAPWACWNDILLRAGNFVGGVTRVVYENDNFDYVVDVNVRKVGETHRITANEWEVEWRTVAADLAASTSTFHLGAHALDRLNAGNVLAA
jgi:hypothetical protein